MGGTQKRIILIRRGDQVSAFLNVCPHAGWPLDTFDGRFLTTEAGSLICAAHMAVFDARSGACLGGPGQGRGLTRLTVQSDGERWLISGLALPAD